MPPLAGIVVMFASVNAANLSVGSVRHAVRGIAPSLFGMVLSARQVSQGGGAPVR